jgi:hypothetical protein
MAAIFERDHMKSKLISLVAVSSAVALVGCGGGGGGEVTKIDGTNSTKYATSSITLPKNSTTLAFDLDGDGTADNKLGAIISGLAAVNLMPQDSANSAVMDGSLVLLMEEVSTDATQQSASNAGTKLSVANGPAMGAAPPKYDGTDSFTINTMTSTAQFFGNIEAGTYTSNNPATSKTPVVLTIELPLVAGENALSIPVTAGRITYKADASGHVTGGQINGALKKTDVDMTVLPAVAALITKQVQAPNASSAIKMFDINMDGTVTVDELMQNTLISNFLAPDVQLFDAAGNYAPNPAKTMKDSLSLGIGFTAVKASF